MLLNFFSNYLFITREWVFSNYLFITSSWQEATRRAKQRTRPTNQRSWKTISLGSSRCSIHSPTIHYHQGFIFFFPKNFPHFHRLPLNFSVSLFQLLVWYTSWVWRYKIKKAPYSMEDASYLTRRSLGVSHDAWTNLGISSYSNFSIPEPHMDKGWFLM